MPPVVLGDRGLALLASLQLATSTVRGHCERVPVHSAAVTSYAGRTDAAAAGRALGPREARPHRASGKLGTDAVLSGFECARPRLAASGLRLVNPNRRWQLAMRPLVLLSAGRSLRGQLYVANAAAFISQSAVGTAAASVRRA